MPFDLFKAEFVDHRVVMIPEGLDEKHRERFLSKLSAAVKQQAELAAKCDAILAVTGEVDVEVDRVLIPHEPARHGHREALCDKNALPEIELLNWVSWSLLRALEAAAPGIPHGGVQVANLYQDEQGRIKLGDFGIAPAYEAICTNGGRRQIHCDAECWAILGEDDAREHGWIAPYFSHELLEGEQRLNPKADQFAAGVLLYMMGTGSHPYGGDFSDPTQMLYFYLEPFAIEDERSEWVELFERAQSELTQNDDKPVLTWSHLVQKLLASDPGERFAHLQDGMDELEEYGPQAWGDATEVITKGLQQLEAGDVEPLLARVKPYTVNEALPPRWREQLTVWLSDIESRQDEIGAYKRLRLRLAEGQAALNNVEVKKAREIAREVLASPRCDEALRAGAEELISYCDEQAEFINSGADDLARTYLESATEYMERKAYSEAREILSGVIHDPATPKTRLDQARRILTEIELEEQRLEQQRLEIAGAKDDWRAGHYDAARQRLKALLDDEQRADEIAEEAEVLLEQVIESQNRRAEYVAALEAARNAWERGDLEGMGEHLALVPEDLSDSKIADVRVDLARRQEPLRVCLELRDTLREALETDKPEAGLIKTRSTSELDDISQILRDELGKLQTECQERVDEKERVRLEQVLGFIQEAHQDLENLEIADCRERLKRQVVPQIGMPEDVTNKTEELFEACERVESVLRLFEHARVHLQDGDYDSGLALLERFNGEGLPAALGKRGDSLSEELIQARRARELQERQIATAEVEKLETRLALGQIKEARQTLESLEAVNGLTDELRGRIATATTTIEELRGILDVLDAVEAELAGESADLARIRTDLAGLPDKVPDWAETRIEADNKRIEELREQRRATAIEESAAALDAAEEALRSDDLTLARKHLAAASGELELEGDLADRHERLTALTTQLEEWLPRIHAVAAIVTKGEMLEAQSRVREILGSATLPDVCREPAENLQEQIERQIAARRAHFDEKLGEFEAELAERGRRARRFCQRVNEIGSDGLATAHHRSACEELLAQWQRLEEPPKSKSVYYIAASAAAIVLVGMGLYWGGLFDGSDEQPNVPATAVAATQAREEAVDVDAPPIEPDTTETEEVASDRIVEAEDAKATQSDVKENAETITPPDTDDTADQVATDVEPAADKTIAVETEPEISTQQIAVTTEEDSSESQQAVESVIEDEPEPEPVVPTLEEITGDYIDALNGALPPGAEFEELSPDANDTYKVSISWQGRSLLPFTNLSFNEQERIFVPAAGEVASYFVLQVEVLKAIGQPVELAMLPGEPVPGIFRIAQVDGLGLSEVSRENRTARVAGVARLVKDRWSDIGFTFTARYTDGELTPDAAAREAYTEYLGSLQTIRLREAALLIGRALKLPQGMQVEIPAEFKGGSSTELNVTGPGKREYARLDTNWNAELLRYETDLEEADTLLHQGMHSVLADGRALELLDPKWADMRTTLLPTGDEIKRDYLASCELLKVKLLDQLMSEPLAVAVELTVGPRDNERRIVIPGRMIISGGVPAWDAHGNDRASAAIETQLADLTLSLEARLAQLAASKSIAFADLHETLTDVTHEKIKRYEAPAYRVSESFTAGAAVDGLIATGLSLQSLMTDNATRDAFPVVFIEYYIGEDNVYGLSWHAATDDSDRINGVSDAKIWQVMPTAKLQSYAKPKQFRQAYTADAVLGERLLGEALGNVLAGSGGGSYGVIIAPDGPLWLTRWEQVRFSPRDVRGVDLRGTPAYGKVSSLRDVLREGRRGRDYGWRRVGLWCVPTLAGQWQGTANHIDDFNLGVLAAGKKPTLARFKQPGDFTFATIADPTLAGDFAWMQFAQNVHKIEMGYLFWDRQWNEEKWKSTPYVSFSLIPVR